MTVESDYLKFPSKGEVNNAFYPFKKNSIDKIYIGLSFPLFSNNWAASYLRYLLKIIKKDGAIILDRDFEMFNIMINYLRSNRSEYPALGEGLQSQMFEQELDFWDVKTTNLEIEERRLRSKINPELIEFFDAEPSKACMEAKKKWRDLGVFRFEEIMRFSNDKNIDYEAKFGKSVKFSHFAGQLDKNGHVAGIGRYIINNGTIYEG